MTVATGADLSDRVAAEIRAALGRLGIRQADLARRMGRNEEWVSTRLKGPTKINLNDLEQIAMALEVQIVDLLPRAVAEIPRTLGYRESLPDRPVDNRPRRRAGSDPRRPSATRTRRVGQ